MARIKNRVLEGNLKYKGTVILTYKIQYPEIINTKYTFVKQIFNQFNREKAFKLKSYAEGELFDQAKETYDFNEKNDYPVMVYELDVEYTVTYNHNYIISLYSDTYTFTGGAHGSTIRKSQNWNLENGKQIPLSYFYPNNPYYIIDILKEINSQIEQELNSNPGQYFEDYCRLVLETFRLENYYIYPDYIEIFFQQYDIAPYSSGIPTFKIPF